MKNHPSCFVSLFLVSLWSFCQTNSLRAQGPEQKPSEVTNSASKTIEDITELKLLEPVWNSQVIHNESVLLLQESDDQPLTGYLAFPAAEILAVRRANREPMIDALKVVRLNPIGLTLTIPVSSVGPFVTKSEFYKPIDAPMSYKHKVNEPNVGLLYAPGRWFHDRQIEVTYRRQLVRWKGPVPKLAVDHLPRTLKALREGKSLAIGVSGDSISTGLDASIKTSAPPNQPGYAELVKLQLEKSYNNSISLNNRSVSGWSISNGLQDLDALLAEKPNLIIMAYGMNDVGRRDPTWFRSQAETFIQRVQTFDPSIEIILVSTMLGNKEWIHTPREMFDLYRDQLLSLTGPGVAIADLTSVWSEMLINKHEMDLTGNGLNHPNDFGHRLYAQVILALLVP